MKRIIRIGTRDSELATWQANLVASKLSDAGYESVLVPIKSEGDIDLVTPLYKMGVQGVFTRSLDIALLTNKIDIAVHSMKDVPVDLPQGIVQAAVLTRGSVHDLLVYKQAGIYNIVATSSIRRKAQWLNRYPDSEIVNLRGNVNSRLQKLENNNWDAAIFAQAGLERIALKPEHSIVLDWMIPAPAQGAIVIVTNTQNLFCLEACALLNDDNTELCTFIERDFLSTLLGGCSTPISAIATIIGGVLHLKTGITSPDGKEMAIVEITISVNNKAIRNTGKIAAAQLLKNGGQLIIDKMDSTKDKI